MDAQKYNQSSVGCLPQWYGYQCGLVRPGAAINALFTDADLQFNGGDSSARYNVILNYANQQGLFNVDNTDSTFNQVFRRYNIRTNLDFRLFKIFEARVDLGGRIEHANNPIII